MRIRLQLEDMVDICSRRKVIFTFNEFDCLNVIDLCYLISNQYYNGSPAGKLSLYLDEYFIPHKEVINGTIKEDDIVIARFSNSPQKVQKRKWKGHESPVSKTKKRKLNSSSSFSSESKKSDISNRKKSCVSQFQLNTKQNGIAYKNGNKTTLQADSSSESTDSSEMAEIDTKKKTKTLNSIHLNGKGSDNFFPNKGGVLPKQNGKLKSKQQKDRSDNKVLIKKICPLSQLPVIKNNIKKSKKSSSSSSSSTSSTSSSEAGKKNISQKNVKSTTKKPISKAISSNKTVKKPSHVASSSSTTSSSDTEDSSSDSSEDETKKKNSKDQKSVNTKQIDFNVSASKKGLTSTPIPPIDTKNIISKCDSVANKKAKSFLKTDIYEYQSYIVSKDSENSVTSTKKYNTSTTNTRINDIDCNSNTPKQSNADKRTNGKTDEISKDHSSFVTSAEIQVNKTFPQTTNANNRPVSGKTLRNRRNRKRRQQLKAYLAQEKEKDISIETMDDLNVQNEKEIARKFNIKNPSLTVTEHKIDVTQDPMQIEMAEDLANLPTTKEPPSICSKQDNFDEIVSFPIATELPAVGDILAFKVMELKDASPVVSNYFMKGAVNKVDKELQSIEIKYDKETTERMKANNNYGNDNEVKEGRFQIDIEGYTSVIEDSLEADTKIVNWNEMYEVRIMLPSQQEG